MRVKAKLIEITTAEQTRLDKILDKVFPVTLLHTDIEIKDKVIKERGFFLVLYVSKEGSDYYLNFTVKREDQL